MIAASDNARAFNHLLSSGVYWLMMLCMVVVAFLPRFACRVFCEYLWPDDIRIGREIEKIDKEMEKIDKVAAVAQNGLNQSTDSPQ